MSAEALRNAAHELRKQATERFATHGPHDARGAALWDAGCHIDPDDGDALNAKRGITVLEHFVMGGASNGTLRSVCGKVWRPSESAVSEARCPTCIAIIEAGWAK